MSLPKVQTCGHGDILYFLYFLDNPSSGLHYKSLQGALAVLHYKQNRHSNSCCSYLLSFLYSLSNNILLIFLCYLLFQVPPVIIHGCVIPMYGPPLLNFTEFLTWMRNSNLVQYFQFRDEKGCLTQIREYSYQVTWDLNQVFQNISMLSHLHIYLHVYAIHLAYNLHCLIWFLLFVYINYCTFSTWRELFWVHGICIIYLHILPLPNPEPKRPPDIGNWVQTSFFSAFLNHYILKEETCQLVLPPIMSFF